VLQRLRRRQLQCPDPRRPARRAGPTGDLRRPGMRSVGGFAAETSSSASLISDQRLVWIQPKWGSGLMGVPNVIIAMSGAYQHLLSNPSTSAFLAPKSASLGHFYTRACERNAELRIVAMEFLAGEKYLVFVTVHGIVSRTRRLSSSHRHRALHPTHQHYHQWYWGP